MNQQRLGKRHRIRCISLFLVIPIITMVLGGCLWKKKTAEDERSAEELYQEGLELIQKERFEEARDLFNKAKISSAETDLELLAQIAVADSYFEEEEFEAARAQYEELFKLHSGAEIGDYLQYRIGECFFWQMDTIDRDPTQAKRALKAYNRLIEDYPDSQYLSLANLRIKKTHTFLAESEFFIGEFYLQKNALLAAIHRFKKALELYPYSGIQDKLLFHLYKTYKALKDEDHADEYRRLLIERFPNSEHIPQLTSEQRQSAGPEPERKTKLVKETGTEPAPSRTHTPLFEEEKQASSRSMEHDIQEHGFDQPLAPIGLAGTYQGKDKDSWKGRFLYHGSAPYTDCEKGRKRTGPLSKQDPQRRPLWDKIIP